MSHNNASPSIPVGRVLEKLDRLLVQKDFDGAELHLTYWLRDAETVGDMRGMLTVVNELIGLYRKLGREKEALSAAERALSLADEAKLAGSITMGTTLVNVATAYKAFGHADTALPLYEKARDLYEKYLLPDDGRLGGLYNNMALALMDISCFEEARQLFEKALAVMALVPGREPEMAVTYCNLADLTAAELGLEAGEAEISRCLEKAMELLNAEGLTRDGNYAYVCEKCAPCFGYYGFFLYKKELTKRAEQIYEGA